MRQTACLLLVAFSSACVAGGADLGAGGNVGFGGAQDIGQFRKILDEGGIPGENTLDANGFFTEHFTELPPPDCGQTLCLHGMLAVGHDWIDKHYQATLQIAMNTPVDPAGLERLPLNLVVVVDTSGSMAADDRIGFVREGLHLLVDQLQEGDRVALVRYSSSVEVLSDLAVLDRSQLHLAINRLVASGSTNIFDGLKTGFAIADESFDLARQNRVIFLSDGLATAGNTSDTDILDMAVQHISKGIGLTSIGVGREFNVDLMRGLAERGAGNFYFLEDAAAVREVFVDELDYFVTPLAVSVRIEVEAGSAYDIGEVLGTRLWKASGESGEVFIPGVFVASRTDNQPDPDGRRGGGSAIFIDMKPRGGQFANPGEVARVRLTYRLPGSNQIFEQSITVNNPADPGVPPAEDIYLSHQAMAEHYAAYNIYLGLRDAARTAQYDRNCALSRLETLDREIASWNAEFNDADISADLVLVDKFMSNLQENGAVAVDTSDEYVCTGSGGGDEYYGDDEVYACSAAGQRAGGITTWALLALVLGLAVRRRRVRA